MTEVMALAGAATIIWALADIVVRFEARGRVVDPRDVEIEQQRRHIADLQRQVADLRAKPPQMGVHR